MQKKLTYLAWALLLAMSSSPSMAGEKSLTKDQLKYDQIRPADPAFMVTTTFGFEGYHIRDYRGIVRGVTVRQPTIGQHLKAEFKSTVGGRMSPFITMCETARQQAYDIMVERAKAAGANAVVGFRYDSSSYQSDDDVGTEVVCYGTAVVVEASRISTTETQSLAP